MEKTAEQKTKKRGRPAGSTNKAAAGALTLSTAEIIDTIKATAGPEDKAAALLKEPTPQNGNNGTSSGRIYCPAEWIGRPVLCVKLTQNTATALKAIDNNKRTLIYLDEKPLNEETKAYLKRIITNNPEQTAFRKGNEDRKE